MSSNAMNISIDNKEAATVMLEVWIDRLTRKWEEKEKIHTTTTSACTAALIALLKPVVSVHLASAHPNIV
jgi:hypothetical protein